MHIPPLLLSFLSLTTTQPLHPRDAPGSFTLHAIPTPSLTNQTTITASQSRLWIGKKTEVFCPDDPSYPCYNISNTAFFKPSRVSGLMEMYVNVPGGQSIYVTSNGEIGYTPQHHPEGVPEGAIREGFLYMPNTQNPSRANGELTFSGAGATGFFACSSGQVGTWLVVVDVGGRDVSGCVAFKAIAAVYQNENAWAYS